MSNSIAPGSSADVNVKVTALTTNPNVPVTYKTIILKKNLVNGVNTLTQEMMSNENIKYVIKYDYILNDNIIIPNNCILEFDGGSISGEHTITSQNTGINAGLIKVFNTDITLVGSWNVIEAYPEWFGAKGDGVNDDTTSITKIVNCPFTKVVFTSINTYIISNTIELSNTAIWITGRTYNMFGRRTQIKNITVNGGIFHISQQTSPGSMVFPTIERLSLIADKPIMFNNPSTAIIADGPNSNIPYGMVPKIIDCNIQSFSKNHVGIGIEMVKCFDGLIKGCEIEGFDIGISLLGCDINLIENNRIRNCNYLICNFSVSTFGSQNEIRHNDMLSYNTGIKTTDNAVRIYDNYFETSNNIIAIDMTNIGFSTYGNSNTNVSGFSSNNQGNRFDIHSGTLYRINNNYRHLYINDIGIYAGATSLSIVDDNGDSSYFKWSWFIYDIMTYDISLPNFNRWTNNNIQPSIFENGKIIFKNNNLHYHMFANNFNENVRHGKNDIIVFSNSSGSILPLDEDTLGFRFERDIMYFFQIKAKAHTIGNTGNINIIATRNKIGYSEVKTLSISDNYQTLDVPIKIDSTYTNQGVAILNIDVDVDIAEFSFRIADYGITSNRPTEVVKIGFKYFDTTLGKPIWYKGDNVWVDATGATV